MLGYPELFSVEDDIFYELHELTKPTPPSSFGCGWGAGAPLPGLEEGEGVQIWEENQVGIYYTTTLSASDPNSLVDWLKDNGYAFPVEGQEVLDYYIQKNWFFIAMKIQSDEIVNNSENYTGAIQPIGIMFFSDERVTFSGATEEYNAITTPDQLKEYPILQGLIEETFVRNKTEK